MNYSFQTSGGNHKNAIIIKLNKNFKIIKIET